MMFNGEFGFPGVGFPSVGFPGVGFPGVGFPGVFDRRRHWNPAGWGLPTIRVDIHGDNGANPGELRFRNLAG